VVGNAELLERCFRQIVLGPLDVAGRVRGPVVPEDLDGTELRRFIPKAHAQSGFAQGFLHSAEPGVVDVRAY
jgi:hypothetical protein